MMKHAFGLFKRKEKKVKLLDADSELDHEFREGLQVQCAKLLSLSVKAI
jgi:hypothetical protein